MNFDGIGKAIAVIRSAKGKSKSKPKDKTLSVTFDPNNPKLFKKYECSPGESIQQIPSVGSESKRNILYICGASGSGKSHYATQYLKEYNRVFKDNPIYFFSAVDNDFGKDLKNLRKIRLNDAFLNTAITMNDVKDCMLVYDDVDVIQDKRMRAKLDGIADRVLQTGRHYNTSMIFTNHLAYNGKETKMILNECHSITFFPNTLGGKARKYLLEQYLGLDNDDIKRLRKLPTRWITIVKGNPMIALYECGAMLMNQLD